MASGEDELIEVERRWLDALQQRDAQALDRMIGDDFHFIGYLGSGLTTREQFIANVARFDIKSELGLEALRVSRYDRWGVVQSRVRQDSTVQGQR
ncbi:MAG: nuclear transport factor 2 family protein, partial [Chloroflexota bacterium]|nr:nuclear transport factor 2 family protein [Chloroflexota bacterium]